MVKLADNSYVRLELLPGTEGQELQNQIDSVG